MRWNPSVPIKSETLAGGAAGYPQCHGDWRHPLALALVRPQRGRCAPLRFRFWLAGFLVKKYCSELLQPLPSPNKFKVPERGGVKYGFLKFYSLNSLEWNSLAPSHVKLSKFRVSKNLKKWLFTCPVHLKYIFAFFFTWVEVSPI